MTRIERAFAFLMLVALTTVPLAAQTRRPAIEVAATAAPGGATVTASNLFADNDMRELMRSGFPASLRYRLELWRTGGIFDDLEGQVEWELIVQYDPSAQRYRLVRRQSGKLEDAGSFATLSTTQASIEAPARVTLVPDRAGARYYYNLTLDIEALSVSDMDQLEQWLRGARRGTAAGAVGSGLRTLMLRMMGGNKRNLTKRSAVFVAEPR